MGRILNSLQAKRILNFIFLLTIYIVYIFYKIVGFPVFAGQYGIQPQLSVSMYTTFPRMRKNNKETHFVYALCKHSFELNHKSI